MIVKVVIKLKILLYENIWVNNLRNDGLKLIFVFRLM